MLTNWLKLLFLILITEASARCLHQDKQHGNIFTFDAAGGAAAYMRRLQQDAPHTMQRIMGRASKASVGTVERLSKLLEEDHTLGLDLESGVPIFECPGVKLDPSLIPGVSLDPKDIAIGGQDLLAGAPDPLAPQAFELRSRSTAVRKIYLDFTGGIVTGTAWNKAPGRSNITIPPFDFDGNPNSFSNLELNAIVAVWRSVSEDYAIFDVDVTTVRPESFKNAMHVRIGGDGAWFGSAGGVAYLSVFGEEKYQPAFIFPKNLGPDYPKFVAEAISHEVGHTLGLTHDGDASNSYFSGQGEWAPIMGIGYYKQLTQFDNGAFNTANNQQDDIATISSYLPLLKQPAGDSIATATALTDISLNGSIATARAEGMVVQPNTANFFSFSANAGTATITVEVQPAWEEWARSNLDAQVVIYDAAGTIVGPAINPNGFDTVHGLGISAAPVRLPSSGLYFIAVSGAGSGSPLVDGYTSYGSRGQFVLTVKYTPMGDQQIQPNPSSSPSPSPDLGEPNTLNPDSSSPNPDQSNPESASPSPEPEQPSPSPGPEPLPIQLSLLSQFPLGFTPETTPELAATSESDSCIQSPSAIKDVSGATSTMEAGNCRGSLRSGRYTLSAAPTPVGTDFSRWECYGVRQDGAPYFSTREAVELSQGDLMTCVAVYVLAPSPSPSPAPEPSPSPPQVRPSPRPSPPPGPGTKQLMQVSQIIVGRSCTEKPQACTCIARVFVVAEATQQPLRSVTVKGTWTSRPTAWSPIAQTGVTTRRGIARFTAQRQIHGGSCSFAVTSMSAKGYVYDAAKSARRQSLRLPAPSSQMLIAPVIGGDSVWCRVCNCCSSAGR